MIVDAKYYFHSKDFFPYKHSSLSYRSTTPPTLQVKKPREGYKEEGGIWMQEFIYIYTHSYVIWIILKYMPSASISTEANSTTICSTPLEIQTLQTKDAY